MSDCIFAIAMMLVLLGGHLNSIQCLFVMNFPSNLRKSQIHIVMPFDDRSIKNQLFTFVYLNQMLFLTLQPFIIRQSRMTKITISKKFASKIRNEQFDWQFHIMEISI